MLGAEVVASAQTPASLPTSPPCLPYRRPRESREREREYYDERYERDYRAVPPQHDPYYRERDHRRERDRSYYDVRASLLLCRHVRHVHLATHLLGLLAISRPTKVWLEYDAWCLSAWAAAYALIASTTAPFLA